MLGTGLPLALVGVVLVAYSLRDVTRERLARFAGRQALQVTVDNGPLVLQYLATTRRWRVAGFVVGFIVTFGASFTQEHPWNVDGFGALVGWFAGAVVAEWQIATMPVDTTRRSASLTRRRIGDYVPRLFVGITGALWLVTLGLGVAVAVTASAHVSTLAELAVTAVATPAIMLVARHILERSQPPAARDVLAADAALRSRSLHVLVGCTVAINGILAASLVSTGDLRHGWLAHGNGGAIVVVTGLFLPIVGFLFGTSPFAARRPASLSRLDPVS